MSVQGMDTGDNTKLLRCKTASPKSSPCCLYQVSLHPLQISVSSNNFSFISKYKSSCRLLHVLFSPFKLTALQQCLTVIISVIKSIRKNSTWGESEGLISVQTSWFWMCGHMGSSRGNLFLLQLLNYGKVCCYKSERPLHYLLSRPTLDFNAYSMGCSFYIDFIVFLMSLLEVCILDTLT